MRFPGLLSFVVLTSWSWCAFADCDCSAATPLDTPRAAGLIFWGTVSEELEGGATFHPLRLYRGLDKPQPEVVAMNEPCRIPLRAGRTYLVFARRTTRSYVTNGCTGTRALAWPPSRDEVADPPSPLDSPDAARISDAVEAAARSCSVKPAAREVRTFELTAAPDDDPLIIAPEVGTDDCVTLSLVQSGAVRNLTSKVRIAGSIWNDGGTHGAADLVACDPADECTHYYDAMHDVLLDIVAPMTESEARLAAKSLHDADDGDPTVAIARTLCPIDGWEAARTYAQNNKLIGGPRWDAAFARMLFDCAVELHDFDRAVEQRGGAPAGKAFEIGLAWAAQTDAPAELPLRSGAPSFARFWAAREQREVDAGLLARIRQDFARADGWANEPVWLETFAEAVAADHDPPRAVRRLGALAYHKAAMLHPAAGDAYRAFARELVGDDEIADDIALMESRLADGKRANAAQASLIQRSAEPPAEQPESPPTLQTTTGAAIQTPAHEDGPGIDWTSALLNSAIVVTILTAVALFMRRR